MSANTEKQYSDLSLAISLTTVCSEFLKLREDPDTYCVEEVLDFAINTLLKHQQTVETCGGAV